MQAERQESKDEIKESKDEIKESKKAPGGLEKYSMEERQIRAAKMIQSAWRRNGFFGRFVAVKEAKTETIGEGSLDQSVEKMIAGCMKRRDKEDLRKIAYGLFSGVRKNVISIAYDSPDLRTLYYLLICLFADTEAKLEDIATVLKDAFKSFKKEVIWRKRRGEGDIYSCPQQIEPSQRYWNDENCKPDEVVFFRHGGGKQHIRDFLAGRSPGYLLEGRGGLGLQVRPGKAAEDKGSSMDYACRAAYLHFDSPAILHAKISAKFLQPAVNSYEAGLRPEHVKELKEIKIDEVKPYSFLSFDKKGLKIYNHSVELRRRLAESLDRLKTKQIIYIENENEYVERSSDSAEQSLVPSASNVVPGRSPH